MRPGFFFARWSGRGLWVRWLAGGHLEGGCTERAVAESFAESAAAMPHGKADSIMSWCNGVIERVLDGVEEEAAKLGGLEIVGVAQGGEEDRGGKVGRQVGNGLWGVVLDLRGEQGDGVCGEGR